MERTDSSKNQIIFEYSMDYFRKQYDKPWLMSTFSYARETKIFGEVYWKLNLADRFERLGKQLEMEFYPKINKRMYMYGTLAFSTDELFPKYRQDLSIYRNIKRSYEGELGIRVQYFNAYQQFYIVSLAKYSGNFWIQMRYLLLHRIAENLNYSGMLSVRYYLTKKDYVSLIWYYGLSPADQENREFLDRKNLNTYGLAISLRKTPSPSYSFLFNLNVASIEFSRGAAIYNDLRISFTTGHIIRF